MNETALDLAAGIELDLLLEDPLTADHTIRFICALRKTLVNTDANALSPELREVEQSVTRIYEHVGFARRQAAYERTVINEARQG